MISRSMPALLFIAAFSAAAQAQAAPAVQTANPAPKLAEARDTWSVRIEPWVWYMAPEGDLIMPGSAPGTAPVKLSTLKADDPEASMAGQVSIRIAPDESAAWSTPEFWKHGWLFSVGGASYSGDGAAAAPGGGLTIGSLNVAGGATVNTDVKWSEFQAVAGKWITGSDFNTGGDVFIDVYAVAGLRVHSQEVTVSSGGGSTTADETFGSAVAGLRLDIQLPYNFDVTIDANVNFWPGDPSSFGYEIAPTFTWRPTPNIGVQVGYRLMGADNESGDDGSSGHYHLDGSLAGLFAGVEIRF